MKPRQRHPVPAADARTLQQLRLTRDLPYQKLADEIGVSVPLLHRVINTERPTVSERSLFKIRQYLALQLTTRRRVRRTA